MGAEQSSHYRSNNMPENPSHHRSSSLGLGCFGCLPNPDRLDLHIDNAELQTHNKELIPKGKVSQVSIAYLSKDEIGFLKACSGRNISALRYYMSKGTNVNLLDEDRTSPLHIACRSGSLQVVEELINWGASVNIADMAGWTPLHIAAFYQRPLICHLLLKKAADPHLLSRNGETSWDLVKDKNTEEIFYVHFDRNDLKKMGKVKKDEPPGEIFDEDIWVNQLEVKEKAFQNRLGVGLRKGGGYEEEKENVDIYYSTNRENTDRPPTENRTFNSTYNFTLGLESTKRSSHRTVPKQNSENQPVFMSKVNKENNNMNGRQSLVLFN